MSRARRIYVYRVDVTSYPPGSTEPGWKPACWSDPEQLKMVPGPAGLRELRYLRLRMTLARRTFKWPRPKLFLSPGSAHHRAFLLTWYGAQATVARSNPVTWPEPVAITEQEIRA